MVNVFDVAEYILRRNKGKLMPVWRLHKLLYYCQAWSLVWDGVSLFDEDIHAGDNSPIIEKLYQYHRGKFHIRKIKRGNPENLTQEQIETINSVLDFYGEKSSQFLGDLIRSETPWREAQLIFSERKKSQRIISPKSMAKYYGALPLIKIQVVEELF